MSFEKIVRIKTPFDKRDPNPSKNYGIGTMQIWMILKGEKGAVQFMFGTGTHTKKCAQEIIQRPLKKFSDGDYYNPFEARGWDVGYHALEPRYEDQSPMDCDILEGGECYYDGSGLRADDWLEAWFASGENEDFIWARLEVEYNSLFGEDA